MKSTVVSASLVITLLATCAAASAHDVVLPAGTLLQCTLNEPNFSSRNAQVGVPWFATFAESPSLASRRFPAAVIWSGTSKPPKNRAISSGKAI